MPVNSDYDNSKTTNNYLSDYAYPGTDKANRKDKTGEFIDAVFADPDEQQVSVDDFLELMVAQLKNQDFMNPVDDTQYVTQLAQFSTMQQMQEMAYNSKTTYVTSLVGKNVTAAKMTVSGDLNRQEGIVDKISLLDGEYLVFVNGQQFKMSEIMEVKTAPVEDGSTDNGSENGGDDGEDGGESGKDNTPEV